MEGLEGSSLIGGRNYTILIWIAAESSSISDETLLLVFTWQIVMLIFIIQNCDWKKHKEDGFGLAAFLEEEKLEMCWWIKQLNGQRL